MRLRLLPLAVPLAALVAVLAHPGAASAATAPLPPAEAGPIVFGMGDQKADMFGDPRFRALGFRRVRRVVAWDALHYRWQREELDGWLRAARAARAEPLVVFGRSRDYERRRVLPSPGRFQKEFDAFRDRYPWVRVYAPWNEVNHCSQPTCHNPRRAAEYYNVIRASCFKCRVVAADLLDIRGMTRWVKEFRRHADGKPRLWGLHNYVDVNRFRTKGTRALLRAVPGEVWLTEVGGLVRRENRSRIRLPDSADHAADVMRFLLRVVARLDPRLTRVYLYHWNASKDATWDSGLIGPTGLPRPAFDVLADRLRDWHATARRAGRTARARLGRSR